MSVMASPSGQQIDIAASVRAAYQFVIDNARRGFDLALVPFAIVVGAEFIAWLIGGGGWFGVILAALIQAAGFAVFGTVFIVRWHRLFLLGETATQTLFPPGWGTFFLTTIKVGLAVLVGAFVLGMIAALPPHFLDRADRLYRFYRDRLRVGARVARLSGRRDRAADHVA